MAIDSRFNLLPFFKKPTASVPLAPVLVKEEPEEIKVEPLLCKDVDKAADTIVKAFADDPIGRYITETPDAKRPPPPPKDGPDHGDKPARRVGWFIIVAMKENKMSFTVNKGESVVFATPAIPERKRPGPAGHIFGFILRIIQKFSRAFLSPEQKRRSREVEWKVKHLIHSNLGKRAEELVHVDLLATTPEKQGKGYGTALMKHIIEYADSVGRGVYLETDTESNVEFYESLGFEVIDEVLLGEHNPTWHEKPVVVSLLVRENKKGGHEMVQLKV